MRHGSEEEERIVRELYPAVYRLVRAMVRTTQDAEDVTQRAVLAVLRKRHGFRGEASLRTWAGRVALTEVARWNRRRRLTAWLSPDLPDPRCPFAEFEAAEALRPALLSLPFPMREAFLLSALGDLPLDDIAALQGVPVGTVKSRLYHARLRLRQRLAPSPLEASPTLVGGSAEGWREAAPQVEGRVEAESHSTPTAPAPRQATDPGGVPEGSRGSQPPGKRHPKPDPGGVAQSLVPDNPHAEPA